MIGWRVPENFNFPGNTDFEKKKQGKYRLILPSNLD